MLPVYAPKKALLLWSVLCVGGMVLGLLLGSWPAPLYLALSHDGVNGLKDIPIRWGWASAPTWMPRSTGKWVDLGGGVLGLGLATLIGIAGGRLGHRLIVHRFRWMTEDEVRRYNDRPRLM